MSQRTGQILFAITRFCYIKVLFHYFTITGAKNDICYIKDFIMIIEVHYINVLLLCLLFAFPKNSFITDLPTFFNIPKRPDTSTPLTYLCTSQNFSPYPYNHSLNKKSWNQEFYTQKYPCHINWHHKCRVPRQLIWLSICFSHSNHKPCQGCDGYFFIIAYCRSTSLIIQHQQINLIVF